jgi:type II secretory pathway predicted ATPase ExeA
MNPEPDPQEAPTAPLSGTVLLSAPFADHDAGYFYYAGPDAAQRLDLLLHLAPYSPLLVIAGKPGTGKTVLLRQFVARAQDSWRIAVVTARVEMGRDELLRDMARGFGLSLDPHMDHPQLYAALIAQLRALRQNAQAPILLLDDAQYLSAAMMELILRLCAENDNGHVLSILLFGTPQLQNLLESPTLAPLAARVTHTFEVTPLDEEETGAYIRHRMRAAGAEEDGPFDAMMINRIYAATGGVPARINEAAQRALSGRPLGGRERPGSKPAAGGTGRRLVLLATATVVALLMIAGPLRTALFKSPPLNGGSRSAPAPAPAMNGEEPVIRTPGTAPPGGGEVKPLPIPPKADTAPEANTPAPAAPPGAATEKAAPSAPDRQAPAAQPPAPAEAPKPPAPNTPPPAVAAPLQGADWVRAQPGGHYTLQLMAIKQEDTARQFIARHHLEGQAAYIRVERGGEIFYAVLYGSYPSQAEAQRAAKGLPAEWDIPTPWVRRFKAVQSQLRK